MRERARKRDVEMTIFSHLCTLALRISHDGAHVLSLLSQMSQNDSDSDDHTFASAARAGVGMTTPPSRSTLGVRARENDAHTRRVAPNLATFSLGEVDLSDDADDEHGFSARASDSTLVPSSAIIRQSRAYQGRKAKMGSVVILVTKKANSLVSMCMHTVPVAVGKDFVAGLAKKNGGRAMKDRHEGIEWVGVDEAGLLRHSKYVKKCGWFANTGTCGSSRALFTLIQNLSEEIVKSGAPLDFVLADVQISEQDVPKLADLMNGLLGKMDFDNNVTAP